MLLALCVLVLAVSEGVWGHGRLLVPPGRSTCFREGIAGCVPNYNDNQLFCGGRIKQWGQNGGKCGVCGDDWSKPQPRANEAGGRYGKGIIVRDYTSGQLIDVTVELTTSHKGWFEFRLCKNDNVDKIITHECLNQNLLVLDNGKTRTDNPLTRRDKFTYKVRLPAGLTCSQCVLQWKYHTGNSWGCGDEGCCTGCGERQEQFYGCADIRIT